MKNWLVCLLIFSLFPLFIQLQWYIPGDGGSEGVVVLVSICLGVIGIFSFTAHLIPFSPSRPALPRSKSRITLGSVAVFYLAFLVLFMIFQNKARTIGPWANLRALMVAKADEIEAYRTSVGIPKDRLLTHTEYKSIESVLFPSTLMFTFPIIQRDVEVRMMQTYYPYVGVDYGGGRNAAFDLRTMKVTYAD